MRIQDHTDRLLGYAGEPPQRAEGRGQPPRPWRDRRRSGRCSRAFAQDDLRAQILKIPGVGAGSADRRRLAEGRRAVPRTRPRPTSREGEFAGVELTFMGLNNQNLHNVLFRGFLQPWEDYTGAKITWIDLAQADYNPRLQQSIATGTVDFDILEMGAPFEGDVCGKGLASEMPDWVKAQIEMDDYVGYLQAPVGTWDGKTYRISIDGDCHTFNYRTDVLLRSRARRGLDGRRRRRANGACRGPGSRSRR